MGFDLHKSASVDVAARNHGVWIDKIKGGDDLELKVLGTQSPAIKALTVRLEAARPDDLEDDPIAYDERTNYEARERCKAGLLDWRNFRIDGKEVPYSAEKAAEIIDDPRFEPFAILVVAAMRRADKVRLKRAEEAEKNSDAGIVDG